MQFSTSQNRPDNLESLASKSIEVIVQRSREIGIADDQLDLVTNFQILRLWAKIQFAVFCAESLDARIRPAFDDWQLHVRVQRLPPAVEHRTIQRRTADDGRENRER